MDDQKQRNNKQKKIYIYQKEIPKTYSKQIKNLCALEQRWMRMNRNLKEFFSFQTR